MPALCRYFLPIMPKKFNYANIIISRIPRTWVTPILLKMALTSDDRKITLVRDKAVKALK